MHAQGVPLANLARPCPPLYRGRRPLSTSLQDAHLPRYHHSALQHLILHVHVRRHVKRQLHHVHLRRALKHRPDHALLQLVPNRLLEIFV